MNTRKNSVIMGAALVLALAVSASSAWANLIIDPSFEDQSAPFVLPYLGGVVSPNFTAGFWGAENATVVTTENGVTPRCEVQMLRMEDEGGVVTQAFQAVDVSADSVCIDSGHARVQLSAWLNTMDSGISTPVQGAVTVFFYSCGTCWGNVVPYISDPINLDINSSTWELSSTSGSIPTGTRWLLIQLGFTNSTLLGRPGYVDCVDLQVDTSGCESSPAEDTTWSQIKALYR
jgi:hypothetical protein